MGPTEPTKAWANTRRALAEQMGKIDGVLPGSVVTRHMRCGKAACACKADPPVLHGPYVQWTRLVDGKTLTRYLTEDQFSRYRAWFDNARRLRDLAAKLEAASLSAFETTEGKGSETKTRKPTAEKEVLRPPRPRARRS
jgi:hypothetical protein